MSKRNFAVKKKVMQHAVSIAIGTMALTNFALAQTQSVVTEDTKTTSDSDSSAKVERVEVTGSSIKRIDKEQASPVTIVTHEEIQEMGANTLAQVMSHVSQAVPDLLDSSSMFGATEGASDINLHGLGPQTTLVLLNGRRLSNYGTGYGGQYQFVNIDTIPADAIERIEILTDGASAIYGSDAIAGVVNVITKTSYVGAETHASVTDVPATHGNQEYNAGISYGFGDLATDKYNVYGTLNVYDRQPVYANQLFGVLQPTWLKFNPTYIPNFYGNVPYGINAGTEGTYSANGQLNQQPGPGCTTPVMPGTPAQQRSSNTICALNTTALGNFWIPASKRVNLFLDGHYEFSNGVEGFAELSGTMINMHTQLQPGSGVSGAAWNWYARNGGLETYAFPYLSATNPYNVMANNPALAGNANGIASLNYTFLDDPSYSQHTDKDNEYRIVAGLRGTTREWDWETALTFAGTYGSLASSGYNPSPQGVEAAFGPFTTVVTPAGTFEVMSDHPAYQLGVNSPSNTALMKQMFPTFTYASWDEITNWDGKMSGKIGHLDGGDLMFAAGANLMHEMFSSPGAANAADGEIAFQGGSWIEGSRTTEAVYAELLAPITKKLEADLAIRDDKYPNFANHIVPKIGLKYQATDTLIVRGTFSQGFRAPSLIESGTGGSYLETSVVDPLRCSQTNAIAAVYLKGTPSQQLIGQQLASSTQCSGYLIGGDTSPNPGLKPETANIGTFGFVFNPAKIFDFSADYWVIDYRNQIVQQSTSQILDNALATNPLGVPGVFTRSPLSQADIATNNNVASICAANPSICPNGVPSYTVGNVSGVMNSYINQAESLYDGFDINANSHLNLGSFGKLDLSWKSTIKHREDSPGPNPFWQGNLVGTYMVPRVTGVFSSVWKYGDYDVGLSANYTGPQTLAGVPGYENPAFADLASCEQNLNVTPSICKEGVGSSTYWTANFDWHPNKQLRVNLNIQNVFNREPRYDPESYSNNGVNTYELAYMYGRIFNLTANYKF